MRGEFSYNLIHYVSFLTWNHSILILKLFNNQALWVRDFVRLHFVDSAIPGVANVSCWCKLGCKIPARVGKKNKLTIEETKMVNSIGNGWRSQGLKVVPTKSWIIQQIPQN